MARHDIQNIILRRRPIYQKRKLFITIVEHTCTRDPISETHVDCAYVITILNGYVFAVTTHASCIFVAGRNAPE